MTDAVRADPLADLRSTLSVLCVELRRRAPMAPEEGGLSNLELIGAVKALETIRVQALSLLESEEDESEAD
jgi:hypothetical protein